MRKPITPALHGALDYVLFTLMLTGPGLLGVSRRARAVFAAFGAAQGGLNALTDQPLAIRRLIPFRTHGTVERNSLPVFLGLPLLAGILRERRARMFLLGAGAALAAVHNLTDWNAAASRHSAAPASPARTSSLREEARAHIAQLPGETALGRRDPAAGGGTEDPRRYAAEHEGRRGR